MKKAILLNDTSGVPHHGCRIVSRCINNLLLRNNIKVIDTNPCERNWVHNKRLLKNIQIADIIIVNGEGTFHHSQTIAMELITIAKYVKKTLSIPVVLINATIQDNDSKFYEYLKYFDLIFVRESLSSADLLKHGIKCKVVPDLSFYKKFYIDARKKKIGIGITDSVFLPLSEKMCNLSKSNDYYFLPILSSPNFSFSSMKQLTITTVFYAKKLYKYVLIKFSHSLEYKDARVFYYYNNYNDYVNRISDLSLIIVGRYHSLCFALKTLTPFIAIKSNSFKIEGMLEDIGIGNKCIQPLDNSRKNIEKNIFFSDEETKRIKLYTYQATNKIEIMFKEISSFI